MKQSRAPLSHTTSRSITAVRAETAVRWVTVLATAAASGAFAFSGGAFGCGGKAVIDRDGSGGATTTTTTTTATDASTTTGAGELCTACLGAEVESNGKVVHPELTEVSGLAASRLHSGMFYVHNDSGDAPRFFVIDANGGDLGTYIIDAAANVDWEDAATGPCAADSAESCLFLGDIGDNAENRGSYTLYRVREPSGLTPGGHNISADTFPFNYPDGSHNAETVIVDPSSADVYIVTKNESSAGLYRFPAPLTPGAQLTYLGDVSLPSGSGLVTGGSAHANGVLLRTYGNVFLYPTGSDVATRLLGQGCPVVAPAELQGEAVEWVGDGTGYLTVAEGEFPPVYQMRCQR